MNKVILIGITGISAIIIIFFSLMPGQPALPQDKLSHFTAYLILTLLLLKTLQAYKAKHSYAIAFIASAAVGLAIELLQLSVGRQFSLIDILANMLGAAIALLLK